MYNLETSNGFHIHTSTVEQVASALATQLRTAKTDATLSWTVTTPHGSVLSDSVLIGPFGGDTTDASAHIEHAYGLLVRDHLTSGVRSFGSGLMHTTR